MNEIKAYKKSRKFFFPNTSDKIDDRILHFLSDIYSPLRIFLIYFWNRNRRIGFSPWKVCTRTLSGTFNRRISRFIFPHFSSLFSLAFFFRAPVTSSPPPSQPPIHRPAPTEGSAYFLLLTFLSFFPTPARRPSPSAPQKWKIPYAFSNGEVFSSFPVKTHSQVKRN